MGQQPICIISIRNPESCPIKIDDHRAAVSDVPGDLGISFPVLGHGEDDPLTGYHEVRVYPPRF